MRVFLITFITASTLLASGCGRGSHAINCVVVDGQKVCFVREVWGFNGDQVALTTSTNVCHQPSAETDFVSDSLGAGERVFYKIDGETLHVYGSVGRMVRPREAFPVAVEFEFERLGPFNPTEADLRNDGFLPLPLEDMTWCFSDLK